MQLLVGCPVYKRDWVLPWWFQYLEGAARRSSLDYEYVFVVDPTDTETILAIERGRGCRTAHLVYVPQQPREDKRDWTTSRYVQMVELRNELLAEVRRQEPDVFLSLDSDILIAPQALDGGLESLGRFDACGTKTYMAHGTMASNYAFHRPGGGLHRPDQEATFPCDVIMAIKLMTKKAYDIDYENDHRGEDIGWSLSARRQGVVLGWDGRFPSKHVMKREQLHEVDPRCGY